MGNRLSKIYTRTGDNGSTGLGDGNRIAKDSARIQAIGGIDELNSLIGVVIELGKRSGCPEATEFLSRIQHRIFDLGGEVSIPGASIIDEGHVTAVEEALDSLNADLAPLTNFILPGGSELIAWTHQARSVCRRAERDLVTLARQPDAGISEAALSFLNRLSDYLFVLARHFARLQDVDEVLWERDRR